MPLLCLCHEYLLIDLPLLYRNNWGLQSGVQLHLVYVDTNIEHNRPIDIICSQKSTYFTWAQKILQDSKRIQKIP